nr:hypothetical protein [Mycoplasmopsis bovis]
MARKLQRFALSKKTNAGFCLGAIFMPILSSILTVSCGVYYNTDRERKFEERFKFFDFKLYEGKINKILRWTGTLERLSHKYKWFNADPEFKKRFYSLTKQKAPQVNLRRFLLPFVKIWVLN